MAIARLKPAAWQFSARAGSTFSQNSASGEGVIEFSAAQMEKFGREMVPLL
jgi:hypothetical protein